MSANIKPGVKKYFLSLKIITVETEKYNYVALKLCGILTLIYGLQVATGFNPGFNASESPFWKFFTSILGHGSLQHLLNNIFFIALFGSLLERYTSGETFLKIFLGSALFANFSAFIFFPTSYIIGASGGGMGIMAALAVYKPNNVGLAMGVPVPMWAALVIYILIDFAGLTAANNVANEAHLLGILAGGFVGYNLRDGEEVEETSEEFDDWEKKIREWEEKWMMK